MTRARATARSAPGNDERRATVATVARRADGQANGEARSYSEPNDLISCLLGLAQLALLFALGPLGALHLLPDLLHDLRVGQRGDVPDVGEVGDVAAITRRMILPDLVFGMSGTIQMFFGRAILPMSVSIAVFTLASTPESVE